MAEVQSGAAPTSWSEVLLKGVSGVIDSQLNKQYLVNEAKYNTERGTAGQAQGFAAVASSPAVWIIGAVLVGAVVLFALRR